MARLSKFETAYKIEIRSLRDARKLLDVLRHNQDVSHCFTAFADSDQSTVKPRELHCTLEDAAVELKELNRKGAGIFFTPNVIEGVRKSSNLRAITGVWCELDDGLPEGDDPVACWPIEPTAVVQSSPGKFHVYWTLAEDEELTPAEFQGVMHRMVQDFGCDPNATDAVRVLRVPGFFNCKTKNGRKPAVATLLHPKRGEAVYYSRDELLEAFPPLAGKTKAKSSAAHALDAPQWRSEPEEVEEWLGHLTGPESVDNYERWWKYGAAIYRAFGDDGFAIWDTWSQKGRNYDEAAVEKKWAQITAGDHPEGGVTLGTIFHHACEAGMERRGLGANIDEIERVEVDREDVARIGAERCALQAEGRQNRKSGAVEVQTKAPEFGPVEGVTALVYGKERSRKGWDREGLAMFLAMMNREHAFVQQGSATGYLFHGIDGTGRPSVEVMDARGMAHRYAPVRVPIDGKRGPATIRNGFDVWDQWHGRADVEGLGFYPTGEALPPGYRNLWTGFGVEPDYDRPEEKCEALLEHIRENICGGNREHYETLMAWLAHSVQKPNKKPGYCVVLHSEEKGTGKSFLLHVMERVFGRHAMLSSKLDDFLGRFNGHLQDKLFVGLDEIGWAGDKKAQGMFKSLITEDRMSFEEKFKAHVKGRSYWRVMVTSNERWVVPADVSERRFFVLNVRPSHPTEAERVEYFSPLWNWLDEGGARAFLGLLLMWQIPARIDLFTPPVTAALLEQKRQSLGPAERFLSQITRERCIEVRVDGREEVHDFEVDEETTIPKSVVLAAARGSFGRETTEGRVNTQVGSLLGKLGVRTERPSAKGNDTRPSVFVFPPRAVFLARARVHLNGAHDIRMTLEDFGTVHWSREYGQAYDKAVSNGSVDRDEVFVNEFGLQRRIEEFEAKARAELKTLVAEKAD